MTIMIEKIEGYLEPKHSWPMQNKQAEIIRPASPLPPEFPAASPLSLNFMAAGQGEECPEAASRDRAGGELPGQACPRRQKPRENGETAVSASDFQDSQWVRVLAEAFPDGYILNDFISQMQAAEKWEELYGEVCRLHDDELDRAVLACGSLKGGRVFPPDAKEGELIAEICSTVNNILRVYSCAYPAMVYNRYRRQLADHAVYTDEVLTQLLLQRADGCFVKNGNMFTVPERPASIADDCKSVMRSAGGAVSAEDISRRLWFIPPDIIHHTLSAENDCINVDKGVWMMAEHFPLTSADAAGVADMLKDEFNVCGYISAGSLIPLLYQRLPAVAENLSALNQGAVFNILRYHLGDSFEFRRAIISPQGRQVDIGALYRGFVTERGQFSLSDLDLFASEAHAPICWEEIFSEAVRVSETEFVGKDQVCFDIAATDRVLESFCGGDYLPFREIQPPVMMHLPPCGYPWNGYLLLSYVYGYSRTFRIIYKSIGKAGCYGAMVRRSAGIGSYEELVERVLTARTDWSSQDEALELLVSSGYQAVKRLKGIEKMIERAKLNKMNG